MKIMVVILTQILCKVHDCLRKYIVHGTTHIYADWYILSYILHTNSPGGGIEG